MSRYSRLAKLSYNVTTRSVAARTTQKPFLLQNQNRIQFLQNLNCQIRAMSSSVAFGKLRQHPLSDNLVNFESRIWNFITTEEHRWTMRLETNGHLKCPREHFLKLHKTNGTFCASITLLQDPGGWVLEFYCQIQGPWILFT